MYGTIILNIREKEQENKIMAKKTEYARLTSIMAKLDNQIKKDEIARKAKKSEKKNKKD